MPVVLAPLLPHVDPGVLHGRQEKAELGLATGDTLVKNLRARAEREALQQAPSSQNIQNTTMTTVDKSELIYNLILVIITITTSWIYIFIYCNSLIYHETTC